MKFDKYRLNLSKSLEKYTALSISPLESVSLGLPHEWIKEVCNNTTELQVVNFKKDWLSLSDGQYAETPSWAYYLNESIKSRDGESYIPANILFSSEFSEYWQKPSIFIRDADGKIIDSLNFGFLGFSTETDQLVFDETRKSIPLVSPIKGKLFGKANNAIARKYISKKTSEILVNVILTYENYYINGSYGAVVDYLEKLYPDVWLSKYYDEVCIERYMEK